MNDLVGIAFVGAFAVLSVAAAYIRPQPPKKTKSEFLTTLARTAYVDKKRLNELKETTFENGIELQSAEEPSNQRATGRCWIFAACNAARIACGVELEPSYLAFFDLYEKAEAVIHHVHASLEEPPESRILSWLLESGNLMNDGGQLPMVAVLIQKYGCVPKGSYGAARAHRSTREIKEVLRTRLRAAVVAIRNAAEENRKSESEAALDDIWHILTLFFGAPDSSNLQLDGLKVTPLEYYETRIRPHFEMDQLVCLVDAAGSESVDRQLRVEWLGYVGNPVCYVSVSIDVILEYSLRQLCELKQPVWVGVSWSSQRDPISGVLDLKAFTPLDDALKTRGASLSKGERLRYGQSKMTHAVLLVGYFDGLFKVENSHGSSGNKGFYHMTSEWFRANCFEASIRRDLLSETHLNISESDDFIALPPWHPLGALLK